MVANACVALAEPIRPTTLDQPASRAVWATRAVLLSIATAGPRLVAVGERGFVLLSDDNGRTWRQAANVPTSVTLTQVRFASPSEGWAVGHMGIVLHTTDGGNDWVKQLDGVEAAQLAVSHAKQALQLAGAADEKRLQRQLKDAELLVSDGPDKPFLSLVALGNGRSSAFGAFGYAFETDDGGHAWIPIFDRTEAARARHIYGLTVLKGTLYAAGEQGLLLRCRQDGRFEALATPYPGTMFGVMAAFGSTLFAYGLRGTLLRSDDEGTQWIEVKSGVDVTLTSGLELGDGRVVFGSQTGQLIASSDGGRTFTALQPAPQPVVGIGQAGDGALIVVGPRGVSRVELQPDSGLK
jgi:photosystem II stability/assembly factor-like uncharacterized protein